MKSSSKIFLAATTVMAMSTAVTLAAGVNLYNGGLGQIAGDAQHFGVAICNGGTKTVTQSVPISVSVNGATAQASSAPSIAPGACAYSYLDYSKLGMLAGKSYDVSVTIDPAHTTITNKNNATTYRVTVPAAPAAPSAAAQTNAAPNETANASTQSWNIFSTVIGWLSRWFSGQ